MLEHLPESIYEQYRHSVQRIESQPSNYITLANTVLAWVSCAIRPLGVDELRHALAAVTAGSESLDVDWLTDQDELMTICKGLVVIGDTGTVRLAHASVKEFFDKNRLFTNASQSLAAASLRYLTLHDFANDPPPSQDEMIRRMDDMPFLRYAAHFWFRHEYTVGADSEFHATLREYLEKLFSTNHQALYLNWLSVHDPARTWIGECPWLQYGDLKPKSYYTTLFGLHRLTENMLNKMHDASQQQSASVEKLYAHVRRGDVEVMAAMLDSGLCSDYKSTGGEPLLMMCENKETLLYLLDRGADPNATDSRGWNALQLSARHGNTEFVRILHRRGAHIPPKAEEESAMHHAVYFGHTETVRYLLENGASRDVNADGEVGPPAHWAAKHGQLEILRLLVQHGADLEAAWRVPGGSAKSTVLDWLLGEGCFYAVQGKPSGWGMGKDHKQVALYLLDRISRSQTTGSHTPSGQTLLHWTTKNGYEEVVREGLARGINPLVQGWDEGYGEYMMAKQLAAREGHNQIQSILERAELV